VLRCLSWVIALASCRCASGRFAPQCIGMTHGCLRRYASSPSILRAALMSFRCTLRSGPCFAIVLDRPNRLFPALTGSKPNLSNIQVAPCSVSPNDLICDPRSRNMSRASLAPGIKSDTSRFSLPGAGLKTGTLPNCSIRRLISLRRSRKSRIGRPISWNTNQPRKPNTIGHTTLAAALMHGGSSTGCDVGARGCS
jgi:hypothetical protein